MIGVLSGRIKCHQEPSNLEIKSIWNQNTTESHESSHILYWKRWDLDLDQSNNGLPHNIKTQEKDKYSRHIPDIGPVYLVSSALNRHFVISASV